MSAQSFPASAVWLVLTLGMPFPAAAEAVRVARFGALPEDGMGDDGVNIGSLYLQVRERVDDRTMIAGNAAAPDRQGPGLSAVFTLGPGCEESTVKLEDNQGL